MANEIGYIVSVESPFIYIISIKRDSSVNRYDYVYASMKDYVDGREMNVKCLGKYCG